ncbi:sugar ABC transporter substrate-binding protein [Arthrobacter sp. MMS18-M83]|uniref:sugar ABC transporter substrate-binding protein n=1 Tax=Arthrobacter sp. MMS18-M83 TaxID=2996261 RepID=UPI00227CDEC5|nr:extracellular solute-binding protein [Arthrobacter sp. MMS18-M83]WAH99168.1 extracellular solute-binding protein [Arthrobacter sp. MMS18-M83]
MHRTKKWSVLAGVLAAGIALAGCSSNSAAVSGDPMKLPPKGTTTTINIWGYLAPDTTPWLGDAEAALHKDFPNVSVKYTYVPYDQIAAKVLGTTVSGGAPDAIIYNPADAANLSQSGALMDMSAQWSAFADKDKFPDSVVWKDGGKTVSVQGYVNTTALYYNKDILDRLGVTPPRTVADLDTALAAASKAGVGGMTMTAVPTAESEFQIFPWLLGNGQNYGSWDEKTVADTFARFTARIDKGYIPKDVVGWSQGDAFDQFKSGKFAFSQNGNWQLVGAKGLPFKWGVVPLPAGTEGSHSVGGGEGFSLGAKTKNAALTWKYFENSLLNKDFELHILSLQGSIPTRSDASSAPEIKSDPSLAVFAQVVADMKARPSTPKIGDYLVQMGKIWNSVAGGQTSPADGAKQVVNQLNNVR